MEPDQPMTPAVQRVIDDADKRARDKAIAAPQPAALPEKLIRFTLRDLKAKREALSGFVAIGNELERAREYDQWIQALELYIAQAALKGKQ